MYTHVEHIFIFKTDIAPEMALELEMKILIYISPAEDILEHLKFNYLPSFEIVLF